MRLCPTFGWSKKLTKRLLGAVKFRSKWGLCQLSIYTRRYEFLSELSLADLAASKRDSRFRVSVRPIRREAHAGRGINSVVKVRLPSERELGAIAHRGRDIERADDELLHVGAGQRFKLDVGAL